MEANLQLETEQDLLQLVKLMPEQGRWDFMKIVSRLQKQKITHIEAAEQVKGLLIQYNIVTEDGEPL